METLEKKDTLKVDIETYNQSTFNKCCNEIGVKLISVTPSLDGYVTAEVQYANVEDLYWLGRLYGVNRLTTKK